MIMLDSMTGVYQATLETETGFTVYSTARTYVGAIGQLVIDHPEMFGVKIQRWNPTGHKRKTHRLSTAGFSFLRKASPRGKPKNLYFSRLDLEHISNINKPPLSVKTEVVLLVITIVYLFY